MSRNSQHIQNRKNDKNRNKIINDNKEDIEKEVIDNREISNTSMVKEEKEKREEDQTMSEIF